MIRTNFNCVIVLLPTKFFFRTQSFKDVFFLEGLRDAAASADVLLVPGKLEAVLQPHPVLGVVDQARGEEAADLAVKVASPLTGRELLPGLVRGVEAEQLERCPQYLADDREEGLF